MTNKSNFTYVVNKQDISNISYIASQSPAIAEGQIKFDVLKLAFTANNITYAVLGDSFRYWEFFPHEKGGVIPAWGISRVVETTISEINEGEIFYGYFPMASHLIVNPDQINQYGFKDATDHRKDLPSVYNYYERISKGMLSNVNSFHLYMLFQPLFATSFLLEYYYRENSYFNADDIFITSASSKTAIAFAFLLKQHQPSIHIIGLTSIKNMSFCKTLGCYDDVAAYDRIKDLTSRSACIVDFSGNHNTLIDLQSALMPAIQKSNSVGLSHWDQRTRKEAFPFKNELFFAPLHARNRQQEWGGKDFKSRLDRAFNPFIAWASGWMRIQSFGNNEVIEVYKKVLNGQIKPVEGIIFDFGV